MEDFDKEKIIKIIYWFTALFIFILQLIFTLNSMSQIRYEELAESVRNVYWFQNHIVYDGVSSNVGWYAILALFYKLFGFSLFSAKIIRLFISFISIFCLALLLKKYLGTKRSFLPLLAIGLSPTFLFFNTLQAQFGIDLQIIPILLYLILTLNFKSRIQSYIKQVLIGLIAIFTWTSYPTFIYYLPALIILYIWQIIKNQKISHISGKDGFHIPTSKLSYLARIFLPLFSFLAPLIFFFIFIKNSNLLLYDPVNQSGIFRGAGKIQLDFNLIFQNFTHLLTDLFDKGNSYYFEIKSSDFSNFYPIIAIVFISFTAIFLFLKNKKYRFLILLSLSIFLFNLIISSITSDPSNKPGIRRNTGILFSIYFFYIISWNYFSNKKLKFPFSKWFIIFIFILLPIHHLLVYPANLAHLKTESPNKYGLWFGIANDPAKSLDTITNMVLREDLRLSCKNDDDKDNFCRYNEIYAAVAGSCNWNNLNCKNILGFDYKTNKFIPLSTKLWEVYYWEH